jgi:branched-chain amino acid transport system substrate-binding protein
MNLGRWRRGVVAATVLAMSTGSLMAVGASGASAASGGTTIVIGTVAATTGGVASSIGGDLRVMQAWTDWTNAHGGIDGRKVKDIGMDTQLSPSLTVSDVTQLIQQDHVTAIVGSVTDVESAYKGIADAAKVPVIGESLYSTPDWTDPNFYMSGTTAPAVYYGETLLGKKDGVSKTADLYCSSAPNCAATVTPLKTAASKLGVQFVYSASETTSAPNYVAPCLAAEQAGANGLNVAAASSGVLNVATSCNSQGYHPKLLASMAQVTGTWQTNAAAQGAIIVSNDAPYFDTSIPAIKTMTAALKKYAPGLVGSSLFDEDSAQAWAAGQLFAAAVKEGAPKGTVTSAEVIKGLAKLKNDTLTGIAPPLTFTAGQGHLVNCFYEVGISGDKLTAPAGDKYFCMTGK